MPNAILKAQTKRCYGCIQWKGERVIMQDRSIKTNACNQGKCLMWRKVTKGRETCKQFTPIG